MMRLIRRDKREIAIILLCFAIWVGVSAWVDAMDKPAEPEQAADVTATADKLASVTAGEHPEEAERIEAALIEQEYFRDDVPLPYELQDYLHTACEEAGVPYELALAVIRQETGFRNVTGDDGCSVGYMQIQERWHAERMDRLGVTDLTDPYGNFQVGCDFLAELLDKCDNLTDALTYYNSGHDGPSEYAAAVIGYMEAYEHG